MGCCAGKKKADDDIPAGQGPDKAKPSGKPSVENPIDVNLLNNQTHPDEEPPPAVTDEKEEDEVQVYGEQASDKYQAAVIPDSELVKTAADADFVYQERDYKYTPPPDAKAPVITILLLGETGSGKSTLVNAMFNYALGVEYNTPVRYRIVKNEANGASQAESQTPEVKVYRVWCDEIGATLRIIDTPGFGDTRGLERDEKITDHIKDALERESKIHAVCFVAAASRPRLTMTQQYIISKVLGCFGINARDHIYVLATFADGKRGPVLDAFASDASFPFSEERSFHFNNSALFVTGDERTEVTRAFWFMCQNSLKGFFSHLRKNEDRPFQLEQTVDVIQTQRRLNEYIKGVLPQVTIGIAKATTLRHIIEDVHNKRNLIDETGNYTYRTLVPAVTKVQKKTGTYTTQCMKCSYSCHQECTRPDYEKHLCCVMDAEGLCQVCPAHCSFADHRNLDYLFQWKQELVERHYNNEKLMHLAAKTGLSRSGALRKQLEGELAGTCSAIKDLLQQISQSYNKLNTLALRPTGLSLRDNLSLLISEETSAKQTGYLDRIAVLEALRGDDKPTPKHLVPIVDMITF
ncbi:Dual specificity protein kinase shkE [Diplonema papillatum]|nr:Dual specificity protein kinase shkE [Diplonema papillatum]|eukprot:gene18101-27880_t